MRRLGESESTAVSPTHNEDSLAKLRDAVVCGVEELPDRMVSRGGKTLGQTAELGCVSPVGQTLDIFHDESLRARLLYHASEVIE
jgi:hypothetical protein